MTNGRSEEKIPTAARFAVGDAVEHNGRPATIAAVTPQADRSFRFSVFYTDERGDASFNLLGRVLSRVGR